MIYDCFLFFNELELLELRLQTLNSVVDCFVLVESNTTFTGESKELYFKNNMDNYKDFLHKIIYISVLDSPCPTSIDNSWNVEYFQRNAIYQGMSCAYQNDKIIISDVDEIPHPDSIIKYKDCNNIVGFPMSLYYYYINCKQKQTWYGSVMAPFGYINSPQQIRNMRSFCPIVAQDIGWHFSFLGGAQRIYDKLNAFSPDANNKDKKVINKQHIEECLLRGDDLFFRTDEEFKKEFVQLDSTYPKDINKWIKKYPYVLKS